MNDFEERPKSGWTNVSVVMYVRVPGELKYLIHSWQNASRLQSFNEAVRRLLETHPELARHAATLYTQGKDEGSP